jgi:hypothetical protein
MVKKVSQENAWSSVQMNCVSATRQRRKNNGMMDWCLAFVRKQGRLVKIGDRYQT